MKNINNKNNNYIYFVYSNITNKIYIGETSSIKRIEIYESFIKENDSINKIRLYNYYTKSNTINYKLAEDIANSKNNFKIKHFVTDDSKELEKTYIRYMLENGYDLYNSRLYKSHKYNLELIDKDLISSIEIKSRI